MRFCDEKIKNCAYTRWNYSDYYRFIMESDINEPSIRNEKNSFRNTSKNNSKFRAMVLSESIRRTNKKEGGQYSKFFTTEKSSKKTKLSFEIVAD